MSDQIKGANSKKIVSFSLFIIQDIPLRDYLQMTLFE